ncbi:putative amidohydrolase [Sphingomonas xinjiangensis]|uniref:Putative amidohydrolase n=2 Tax=Sphingomonas xinjiangensis TaxID=643568 RepID=A0A840YR70_9SPHN|nr:nitrilase-related carbon-nitrogen hydrolase [Sphingomonas xinjiangensis]MBB5711283.1 putative amidohydrolase [Sphingomonas xinjiangensis]
MSRSFRVATVQFQHRAGDKDHNLGRIEHFAEAAAAAGAQIACLPEMCISGYWHLPRLDRGGLYELAEPVDGPSVSRVATLAENLGIGIGVGWLERDAHDRLYNAYRLCLPNGGGHTHRKLHAFEHPLISSGQDYTVFDTPWGVRMSILICWDNNLVENPRVAALRGAEVLLAPHQTGGTKSLSPKGMKHIPLRYWEERGQNPERLRREFQGPNGRGWLMRWLPARAHDNGLFIVFSNGVGRDEDELRTGNAMILDPYGDVLSESNSIGDDIVTADLDIEEVATSSGRRWMCGRRPNLYGSLAQRLGTELSPHATRFGLSRVGDVEFPI